jgi:putative component of membrane protein insertase Oxa1/YidC/SpoIIIJ protein YidD
VEGFLKLSEKNFLKSEKSKGFITKFLKKDKKIIDFIDKEYPFSANLKVIPVIRNSFISFKVKDINIEKIKISEKIKKNIIFFVEKINIKNKKLESMEFFASIKSISYKDNSIFVNIGFSSFLLFCLIVLFSLREIGLLLIVFYQKFLSDKKSYKCAKGAINGTGTCSSSTKQAFKKGGFFKGMKVYFQSTKECRKAYESSKSSSSSSSFCDVGVGACDAGVGAGVGACDLGAC